MVNGFKSQQHTFHAGVRQGCPLSPRLYLFVAQALLCWWKANGQCLRGPGSRALPGVFYADDATRFVETLHAIPGFTDTMDTFAAASNQRLEPAKTVILQLVGDTPVEALPPWAPGQVAGMKLVTAATLLGVLFGPGAAPVATLWTELIARVGAAFTRISKARLSAFGRGFAASAYGVAKIRHVADLSDLPPVHQLHELERQVAALIDREGKAGTFAGLAASLLPGRPLEGGWGALPSCST